MPLVRKPVPPVEQPGASAEDVLKALASSNPEARWGAARRAAQIDGGAAALAAALHVEADTRVREAMFNSLVRIGSAESIDAILPLLRVDDAAMRAAALDALRAMAGAVRECLPTLLSDSDSDIRVLSCEIARSLSSDDATRMLCDLLLRETQSNVCAAAIEVLAEVGSAAALPVLAQCASRFRDTPFVAFSIKITAERIRSQAGNESVDRAVNPQANPSTNTHG